MDLVQFLYIIPAALIAISMHEFAHGFVSYKLGDPTPKIDGRLSLNPFSHLDPFGTLSLIIFGFGWAKPVRVNHMYYKNKKLSMVLVALAGPLTNFIIAFFSLLLSGIIVRFFEFNLTIEIIYFFLEILAIINIGLGAFNLIPIPPLDGSKIVGALLPESAYFSYMKYEQYGALLLVLLLTMGYLDNGLGAMLTFIQDSIKNSVNFLINLL